MPNEEKNNVALDKLAQLRKSGKRMSANEAQKWFKQIITKSKFASKKKGRIGGATNRVRPGTMMIFKYDAKTKEKLPYWDRQPMGIVVDILPDGFTMLNFHYLPAAQRIVLLEALLTKQKGKDEKAVVDVSYSLLKGASRYKWYKPTYKRYLRSHLDSKMILIPIEDWQYAVLLPTQKFQKQSRQQVYKDSLRIGRG